MSNQNAVACDSCDTLFHTKCLNMHNTVLLGLQDTRWVCCTCGLPNFSTTLFTSTTADSINTSVATDNTSSIQGSDGHQSQPSRSAHDISHTTSFSSVLSSPGRPQFTSSPVIRTRPRSQKMLLFAAKPDYMMASTREKYFQWVTISSQERIVPTTTTAE